MIHTKEKSYENDPFGVEDKKKSIFEPTCFAITFRIKGLQNDDVIKQVIQGFAKIEI